VTLIFDPATLTFDLWPWILVVYQLRCGQAMYQIWAKSSNPGRSYCDLNIWPNDLEHLAPVALYDLRKFAASLNSVTWHTTFFADGTLCHAVTFTFDSLTLNVRSTSGITDPCTCMCETWAKSNNPRLSYW